MLTRRKLLMGAAIAPAFSMIAKPVLSEITLGSARVTTLSDGNLTLPKSMFFDALPQDELAVVLQDFDLAGAQLMPECNLALYQDDAHKVLFDVGSGPDFMPDAGKLQASLDALGLSNADITHVVFTHCHPDHLWGLFDDFDEPMFSQATYMMGRVEWDYWWDPETVNTIDEGRTVFAVGAKRRLEALEDQITLFEDGAEILPGIAAFMTPGHTPGHMSFELRQGSQSAMILGDAIGNHHISFRKPSWFSPSDQDQERAVRSRQLLFDRLVNEQMQVVGFHLPNGGLGHAQKHQDGYKFVQA